MKEIFLTQGKVALVDDGMFEELNQRKWYAHKEYNTFYAIRQSPQIKGKRCLIYMHHAIIGFPPKGFETDHKNGVGLDNQRHNLRFVTCRQNQQNRKNQKKTSQYSGVYWDKDRQKWVAQIRINGIKKKLGHFKIEREAFEIYCQAVEAIGEKVLEGANL